ncbi:hypothetical protein, partial [Providencia rettgeri]
IKNVKGKYMTKKIIPIICALNVIFLSIAPSIAEEYCEPTMKRNLIKDKGKNICFSIRPLPICTPPATAVSYVKTTVQFNCVTKGEHLVLSESEQLNKIITRLENKDVDYSEDIAIPRYCTCPSKL